MRKARQKRKFFIQKGMSPADKAICENYYKYFFSGKRKDNPPAGGYGFEIKGSSTRKIVFRCLDVKKQHFGCVYADHLVCSPGQKINRQVPDMRHLEPNQPLPVATENPTVKSMIKVVWKNRPKMEFFYKEI